jgi:hypothetical protein
MKQHDHGLRLGASRREYGVAVMLIKTIGIWRGLGGVEWHEWTRQGANDGIRTFGKSREWEDGDGGLMQDRKSKQIGTRKFCWHYCDRDRDLG